MEEEQGRGAAPAEAPAEASAEAPAERPRARVAFVTAIYGGYEASCKRPAPQTVPADFVCFADDAARVAANGWEVDAHPYHLTHPSPLDEGAAGAQRNSLARNRHTFNIAKYYKQAFLNVPRLRAYDVVVWVDGTVEVTCPRAAELLLELFDRPGCGACVATWRHEHHATLAAEAAASRFERYTSTRWNGQDQPYQDVDAQAAAYAAAGYSDAHWAESGGAGGGGGCAVWLTCFAAWDVRRPEAARLLDAWYAQTLAHTTQDQVGLPFALFREGLAPHTLPDGAIRGDRPHDGTDLYRRHAHGL